MSKRIIPFLIVPLLFGGGLVYFNAGLFVNKFKESIFEEAENNFDTLDKVYTLCKSVENNKELLPEGFVNEILDSKQYVIDCLLIQNEEPHYVADGNPLSKYVTYTRTHTEYLEKNKEIYDYFTSRKFEYLDVDKYFKMLPVHPYLFNVLDATLTSEENYTIRFVKNIDESGAEKRGMLKVEIFAPKEKNGEPVLTDAYSYSHYSYKPAFSSTWYDYDFFETSLYKLFDEGKELKDNGFAVDFAEPYVIKLTSEAGTFRFDIRSNITQSYAKQVNELEPHTFNDFTNSVNKMAALLEDDFIQEFNSIKDPLGSLMQPIFAFSNDQISSVKISFDQLIEKYKDIYPVFYENEFKYFKPEAYFDYFEVYPYLVKYKDRYIENEDGYNLLFEYDNTGNGTCSLTFNIPLTKDGAAEELVVEYEFDGTYKNSAEVAAYSFLHSEKLKEAGIAVNFVSPGVISVTTAAGEFVFENEYAQRQALIKSVNQITPSNYASILSDIDANNAILPSDFLDEVATLRLSITNVMSSYGNMISDYSSLIIKYSSAYSIFTKQTFKYFDTSRYLQYFMGEPYIMDRTNTVFTSKEGYTFSFNQRPVDSFSTKIRVTCVFNIPLAPDSDPQSLTVENKILGGSYGIYLSQGAYYFFTTGEWLSEYGITLQFVSPYVISITTQAGTFVFDMN